MGVCGVESKTAPSPISQLDNIDNAATSEEVADRLQSLWGQLTPIGTYQTPQAWMLVCTVALIDEMRLLREALDAAHEDEKSRRATFHNPTTNVNSGG